MIFGHHWAVIGLAFGVLTAFGIWYNGKMAVAEEKGYDEILVAWYVAFGVAVVLAFLMVLDLEAGILALCLFVCAGVPMIAGYTQRYLERRTAAKDAIRDEVRRDQAP